MLAGNTCNHVTIGNLVTEGQTRPWQGLGFEQDREQDAEAVWMPMGWSAWASRRKGTHLLHDSGALVFGRSCARPAPDKRQPSHYQMHTSSSGTHREKNSFADHSRAVQCPRVKPCHMLSRPSLPLLLFIISYFFCFHSWFPFYSFTALLGSRFL